MEGIQEVKVKVISREMMKPSSPTPSHLKNFTLSYVDQIIPLFPPFLTPSILLYPATPRTQPLDHISRLKSCLSQTLTKFYPLAGRVHQSTINCNDEGIPFIETQVNCPLLTTTILNSTQNLDSLPKLLPPQEALGIIVGEKPTELIHIGVQINVFTCGGIAIGWYDIHKLTDGISSANFFNHWASITRGCYDDNELVVVSQPPQPDFGAAITTFPPSPNAKPLFEVNDDENIPEQVQQKYSVIVKSFVFKDAALRKLKARAASHQVPNPTRFLTVAGFIWEQALASKNRVLQEDTMTALALNLDLRPRIDPPLPKGSIGNLVTGTVALAGTRATLPEFVANTHAAICTKKDEIKGYNGVKGVEAMRANWDKAHATMADFKGMAYKMTSWCNLGFSDLDFGFGKPKWVIPTDGNITSDFRNLIILNDYIDSDGDGDRDGFEAWLFLEETEMKYLESNQEFLAFASPVF